MGFSFNNFCQPVRQRVALRFKAELEGSALKRKTKGEKKNRWSNEYVLYISGLFNDVYINRAVNDNGRFVFVLLLNTVIARYYNRSFITIVCKANNGFHLRENAVLL